MCFWFTIGWDFSNDCSKRIPGKQNDIVSKIGLSVNL